MLQGLSWAKQPETDSRIGPQPFTGPDLMIPRLQRASARRSIGRARTATVHAPCTLQIRVGGGGGCREAEGDSEEMI